MSKVRKLHPAEARGFNIWQTTPWTVHLTCDGAIGLAHKAVDLILSEDRTGVICPTCKSKKNIDKLPPVIFTFRWRPIYPLGQAKWAPEDLDIPLDYVMPGGELTDS